MKRAKRWRTRFSRKTPAAILFAWVAWAVSGLGQTAPTERTFPESPTRIENAIKSLRSSAGRLPILDGFVVPANHPMDRYQRGYYQCSLRVTPVASGGSLVRISAKITAWYADPDPAKSGYQELTSNGRIESDLFDRLEDALGGTAPAPAAHASAPVSPAKINPPSSASSATPMISAPMHGEPVRGEPIGELKDSASSPFKMGTAGSEEVASLETRKAVTDKHVEDLTKEAKNLEEILKNQSHPTNLAAVKKTNTPVLTSPSEGAKVLFLAAAEDEFEILDINPEWVHVRISGLSRGWIRRSSLQMSSSPVSDDVPAPAATPPEKAPLSNLPAFQVENEQIASFPGNWEPLRGKTVKIVSVQKAKSTGTGSEAKLQFAKSIFTKEYTELTQTASIAAGVVVIFDSEDGGMLATTLPVLQLWKAGTLSDEALWRRCYFDPPEMFDSAGQ